MKKILLVIAVVVSLAVPLFSATSVSEQVATSQQQPYGSVVTIGLSRGDGTYFSLSGGIYSATKPGAMALPLGAGNGVMIGYGSRLQYTTFGNNGSYKITATVDETGSSYLLVGITEISNEPFEDRDLDSVYDAGEERYSGDLGTIETFTINGDLNGTGDNVREKIYTDYGGITPAMFRLFHDVYDTLISGINGSDAWTGTGLNQGAQLFYDLVYPKVCLVTYTISEE